MFGIFNEERKASAGAIATEAERAALWSTAFFGSGTYKVDGNKVVLRYDTSSSPTWVGAERRTEVQISGNVLRWTSPTIKGFNNKDVIVVTTFERLE